VQFKTDLMGRTFVPAFGFVFLGLFLIELGFLWANGYLWPLMGVLGRSSMGFLIRVTAKANSNEVATC
jgi:hypothetical protein